MSDEIKYCIQCGARIPAQDRFCSRCGFRQPDAADYIDRALETRYSDAYGGTAPVNPSGAAAPPGTADMPVREKMFRVAETSAWQKHIRALIITNPEYQKSDSALAHQYGDGAKIYRDLFRIARAGLVLHRDGTVEIQCNDTTVGVAAPEDAAFLQELLQENRIVQLRVEIYGGRYKKVYVDYGRREYEVERRDGSDYIVMGYVTYRDAAQG